MKGWGVWGSRKAETNSSKEKKGKEISVAALDAQGGERGRGPRKSLIIILK